MTHIVIDAREIYTTTGRYIERLIHYLQQTDQFNRYTILVRQKDFDRFQLTNPNFSKQVSPYKEFTLGEQLGFTKQLYGLKADLVHFGMTQQPLLYFKRSVTTIHDLTTIRFYNPDKQKAVFWIKQQIYKVVILWAAHKSKRVITPSHFVADDLTKYAKIKDKITVTYESADKVNSPAAALPYLQNKKFIMYIGRPTPHKNLDRLVEAFRKLRDIDPSLHLVLAGKLDTNYNRLKQRLDQEGQTNIVFTDFVSDAELRWLYENTLVYCFPSLSEGFGLPGLEAMRYGAPVASSNATCLPEIYGDGALYFDPKNVDDMVATISVLLADPALRQKTADAGRLQAEKYSWLRMAEQTLQVYQKALS